MMKVMEIVKELDVRGIKLLRLRFLVYVYSIFCEENLILSELHPVSKTSELDT